MSTLKVDAIVDKDSGNTTTINGTTIGPNLSISSHNTRGKNLIINGAAQVFQRGGVNATSIAISASGSVLGPDRFRFSTANLDNLAGTFTQVSDSPDGFGNSLKLTITTADTSIASDEYAYIAQLVEAQNVQHLAYGSSGAKQVTLSFYVKSSVTGTFAAGIYKPDNTAQIHNLTYTINSANTWEYKTLTFAANTLSGGAIDDNTGIGFYVNWHLAAGSGFKGGGATSGWSSYANSKWADGQATDAVITTTNATFQLTGCQLEVGDAATEFEHESYGQTLSKCQRYFHAFQQKGLTSQATNDANSFLAVSYGSNNFYGAVFFPTAMRIYPAISSGGSWFTRASNNIEFTASMGIQRTGNNSAIVAQAAGTQSGNEALWVEPGNGSFLYFDSEL